jgi:hypothetical protein
VLHSQRERSYRCKRCAKTFSETKGTALYPMHKLRRLVLTVITLLAHGCPIQTVVEAFFLDERMVARWQKETAERCRRVHQHLMEARNAWSFAGSQARRTQGRDGGRDYVAGFGTGGRKLPVAWWGRKGASGPQADPRTALADKGLRLGLAQSYSNAPTVSGLLCQGGSAHLPGSFAHGKSRLSLANIARRGNGGEGQKAMCAPSGYGVIR